MIYQIQIGQNSAGEWNQPTRIIEFENPEVAKAFCRNITELFNTIVIMKSEQGSLICTPYLSNKNV